MENEIENELIPDPKEEIIMIDKPIRLRGGKRPDNPKIIGKKKILGKIGAKQKISPKPTPKKQNAEILVDTIVKTYWTKKWKDTLDVMKFTKRGFNKKRSDFRSLCMLLNLGVKYHKYLYLNKLFDNMEKLPINPDIKHDSLYGKITIINKANKPKEKEKEEKEKKDNGVDKVNVINIKTDEKKKGGCYYYWRRL